MRSDLIFGALAHVTNRYQLCQLASKATRKLHKPNTRLQDTTNDVLVRFHNSNPVAGPVASFEQHAVEQRRAA
ncbi:MAG: DNA-directed RNA polymerase subunit omega [Silvibacterium sp.]|nr:DNA-directed RNA polymerase subunit omega [Silvibacterium sp.]